MDTSMNLITDGSDPYFVYDEDEPLKTCDKKICEGRCDRKAYREVYWKSDETRYWSYLCRYHYYMDRIKNFIFRWRNWYCELDD